MTLRRFPAALLLVAAPAPANAEETAAELLPEAAAALRKEACALAPCPAL